MRYLFSILLLFPLLAFSQWNANAGLVRPYTKNAQVITSSGTNQNFVNDGNQHTNWYSSNPLPDRYIKRPDQNVFFKSKAFRIAPQFNGFNFAVDGDSDTKAGFLAGTYELVFDKPFPLRLFTVKLQTEELIDILLKTKDTTIDLHYYESNNFKHQTEIFQKVEYVNSILIKSNDKFSIFEMAGLAGFPVETVVIDMNQEIELGWVSSKHYNISGVESISLSASNDGESWTEIARPNPQVVAIVPMLIQPTINCRYLRYDFQLSLEAYNKAVLWEVIAYGPHGPYVPPEAPKKAKRTYAEAFGINSFWGWGYSVYSDILKEGQGQYKFNKLAKNARNYHRLDWDMRTPDTLPNYQAMAEGKGTAAEWWMNWNTEYNAWKDAGLDIDATITFKNPGFMDTLWRLPEQQSYEYGKLYGQHFYTNNALVKLVEVGNEPWNYKPQVYQNILQGMSRGLKESAPGLSVISCAVQAYSPMDENLNYISSYINKTNYTHLNGLNTHVYSYVFNEDGIREAVNPEDPRSEVWGIPNLQKYMRINKMGFNEVYVTEYGYDSDGAGDDCTHSECVTEFEQAIYGVRKTLLLYRLGVAQMYWYYFIDIDYDSFMHNRSGLTAPYSKAFKEKMSFFAFKKLYDEIGDLYFDQVIQEDKEAVVYAFADDTGKQSAIIAWLPTSDNHLDYKWISIKVKASVSSVSPLVDKQYKAEYKQESNSIRVKLTGMPLIIKIND